MELWDAYDKELNKIKDVTLVRGEPVPAGLYHLVCDVIVKHTDGSWLLMRRDRRKQFGGMWEATAGGSALKNESPLECALRELREETGIKADSLREVGRVVSRDTVYVEFMCVTDIDRSCVTLQEGETEEFKWVSREELLNMKNSELVTRRMQGFVNELQADSRAELKARFSADPPLYADIEEYLGSGEWQIEYESGTALHLKWNRGWLNVIAAFDFAEARRLISGIAQDELMVLRGCEGLRELAAELGFNGCSPCRQAVYPGTEPLPADTRLVIRRPDEKDFKKVFDSYSLGSDEEIKEDVAGPDFIGGYLNGEMVGYIGVHGEGSMGMLHVFEPYRRRGYAEDMYRTLINRQLEKGRKPYAQIIEGNEASLELQRKLGLKISKGLLFWMWSGD